MNRRSFFKTAAGTGISLSAPQLMQCLVKVPDKPFEIKSSVKIPYPDIQKEYIVANKDDLKKMIFLADVHKDYRARDFFSFLLEKTTGLNPLNYVLMDDSSNITITYEKETEVGFSIENNNLDSIIRDSTEDARKWDDGVMQLQSILLKKNCFSDTIASNVDGQIGDKTLNAIKKYREIKGLSTEKDIDSGLIEKLKEDIIQQVSYIKKIKYAAQLSFNADFSRQFRDYLKKSEKLVCYEDAIRIYQYADFDVRNIIKDAFGFHEGIKYSEGVENVNLNKSTRRVYHDGQTLKIFEDGNVIETKNVSKNILDNLKRYNGTLNEIKFFMKRGGNIERNVYRTYWRILPYLSAIKFVSNLLGGEDFDKKIISVITQESTGEYMAQSSAGAYGLMQMVEKSGFKETQNILKNRNYGYLDDKQREMLKSISNISWEEYKKNPELQILCGSIYLHHCMNLAKREIDKKKIIEPEYYYDKDDITKIGLVIYNAGQRSLKTNTEFIESEVVPLLKEPLYYIVKIKNYFNVLKTSSVNSIRNS